MGLPPFIHTFHVGWTRGCQRVSACCTEKLQSFRECFDLCYYLDLFNVWFLLFCCSCFGFNIGNFVWAPVIMMATSSRHHYITVRILTIVKHSTVLSN